MLLRMKNLLSIALLIASAVPVSAEESCALKAARLLSAGPAESLAAMFSAQSVPVPALKDLAARVGELSAVQVVHGPRFKVHRRLSVSAVASAGGGVEPVAYWGHWVNADSTQLGAVQLHMAQAPGSACTLLAVHVDSADMK